MEPPLAQYWCELTKNKNSPVGGIRRGQLDHRTAGDANPEAIGRINTLGLVLVEAQEQILAKSLAAGAEAADRIQQQAAKSLLHRQS